LGLRRIIAGASQFENYGVEGLRDPPGKQNPKERVVLSFTNFGTGQFNEHGYAYYIRNFMRLPEQRLAYEIERRRYMPAEHTRSADLPVVVCASILGFAVLFAMMVYIFSASQ
jgi:hypothetical protein